MPQLVPDALALLACLVAVILDERTRRIPNWLTGGTALLAIATHVALALLLPLPLAHLGWVLAAGAVGFVLFVALSFAGFVGFGDSKLLGAVALCVGWWLLPRVIVYTFLAGGLLALVQTLRLGKTRAVLANLGRAHELPRERVDEAPTRLNVVPYGAAIALGTAWAIAGRYYPVLAAF